MKYYIGIDLGTSSMKMLLMNESGRIVRTVSYEYPVYYPQKGWSQQNPSDWVDAMEKGICDFTEFLGSFPKEEAVIAGIGIGGQMHGLVALDQNGDVIRPAILWNDSRADLETTYLNQEIGEETLLEETANIAFTGFMAPKILWMKKHEPELFARIAHILLPKDYLNYVLTGVFSTDVSDASGTLLFHPERRCWSEKMLSICSLTPDQMPAIHESYEVIGNVQEKEAERLGLTTNVSVVAGAGDNAAAAIGTGVVREGDCNISLGTSGTVFICSHQFRLPESPAIHAMAHANGKYHLMGCMLSAASCNKWWIEDVLRTSDYNEMEQMTADADLGENEITFLPYLMGERSPHNDPFARGAFVGMSLNTTQEKMSLAILEGVAFGLRDSVEIARQSGISIKRSMICGGGARSALWKRIISSVCQLEIVNVVNEEGPSLGAAILAAVGCGSYSSVETAADQIVQYGHCIGPEPDLVTKYDKKFVHYRRLYQALKGNFLSN